MLKTILAAVALCAALLSSGAGPSAPASTNAPAGPRRQNAPVYSPQVDKEGKVTFRLRAPDAKEVKLAAEWGANPEAMAKNDEGIWSVTLGPLQPEIYGYAFVVDGVRMPDPGNPLVKPMRSPTTSILDIPGKPPLIHDFRDVPHGSVTAHWYKSTALGIWRRVHVYTPPEYGVGKQSYPTLYLFHGSGDNDATWTELGRANAILDNLIADKKARPMVIVMPDGHPLAGQITGSVGAKMIQRNLEAFAQDVLEEVIPFVEKEYRIIRKREGRAIAGLSMGGGQSLHLGLNHPDLFTYVGGFSSYVAEPQTVHFTAFESSFKPQLIWIGCGKDDRLVENAKELSENLKKNGVNHQLVITEGNHSWPVWRKYLAGFAPMLFQKAR